jgi:putative colanic acid biosynthesis acetyltransferase WcaF
MGSHRLKDNAMSTTIENYTPPQTSSMPVKEKLLQRVWEMVRVVVFGISPFWARKWRLFWLRLFARVLNKTPKIAWTGSVASSARMDFPWNISLGHRVTIDEGAWVYGLNKIVIEDLAIIGRNVKLITGTHDVQSRSFDLVTKPILIGSGAWIATGAIILPGVTIGEGAIVGAGAVVTHSVEPWMIVAGNPAKVIGKRELKNV